MCKFASDASGAKRIPVELSGAALIWVYLGMLKTQLHAVEMSSLPDGDPSRRGCTAAEPRVSLARLPAGAGPRSGHAEAHRRADAGRAGIPDRSLGVLARVRGHRKDLRAVVADEPPQRQHGLTHLD